jgi:acyl-CoA thioesterase
MAQLSDTERARVREFFERVPFAQLLGLKLGHVERGAATLRLEMREELMQNAGLLHGGVIASLIDTAAAFATLTLLSTEERATTVNLTVQYLRPATNGHLSATATVSHAGRRLIALSATVSDSTENIIATALTVFIRQPLKSS